MTPVVQSAASTSAGSRKRAVGRIEAQWRQSVSRRKAIAGLAGALAGSPLFQSRLAAQLDPRPLQGSQAAARARRDDGLVRLRAGDVSPTSRSRSTTTRRMATAPSSPSAATARRSTGSTSCPGRRVDPKSVDLSTEILGTRMKYPIMVAPSAVQVPLHPDGEIGMHRGATAASNTPMILSQVTSTPVDKVAAAATGPLWAQFYPQQDRAVGRKILRGGAGRRLHRGRGHGRSAGLVLRTHRAESEPRAADPRRAGRGGAADAPADWPGRACIACPRGGSGTRGSTSTRFARSSRCRCS